MNLIAFVSFFCYAYSVQSFSNSSTIPITTFEPKNKYEYECVYEQSECDIHHENYDPYRCCGCYLTEEGNECSNIDRKSQLAAFLLQLFLPGLSIGCWMLGQYAFAASMMGLSMLSCCCKIAGSTGNSDSASSGAIVSGCLGCILAILQVTTLIMIGMNQLLNISGEFPCVPTPWGCI
tara:strand:- start:823 stop:1356 length:534 start_codon:yes stop_codon:yes gene_type:complete